MSMSPGDGDACILLRFFPATMYNECSIGGVVLDVLYERGARKQP